MHASLGIPHSPSSLPLSNMVKLIITPKRGNHARHFPHHGFLGLSPVVLSGIVSTRVEEDGFQIEASRLVIRIRCYEGLGAYPGQGAGLSSASSSSSSALKPPKINVLWETEKVLWTPPESTLHLASSSQDSFGLLGNSDTPWKLVIPPSATQRTKGGHAVGSMSYRTWGAWWQVEAVIQHRPSGIYGSSIIKSHPIYLPNYSRPLPDSVKPNVLQSNCTRFAYAVTAPSLVACGDLAQVSLSIAPLSPPAEPFVLKKLSVSFQRTLAVELDPDSSTPNTSDLDKPPNPSNTSAHPPSAQQWKLRHVQPHPHPKPSSWLSYLPSSRHTSAVTTILAESEGLLKPDMTRLPHVSDPSSSTSHAPHHVSLQIPKPKSRYHYSIGDSCQTKWASVHYSLIVKVVIKSKSTGLETITLNALPVELMSVSNSDLAAAIASLRLANLPPPPHSFRRSAPSLPAANSTDNNDHDSFYPLSIQVP